MYKLLDACKSGMGLGLRPSAAPFLNSHVSSVSRYLDDRRDAGDHIPCNRSPALKYVSR